MIEQGQVLVNARGSVSKDVRGPVEDDALNGVSGIVSAAVWDEVWDEVWEKIEENTRGVVRGYIRETLKQRGE